MLQKSPERAHLPGDAVRRADDQDRVIQHLQDSLHLCGKIGVSGRIHQGPDSLDLCPAARRSGCSGCRPACSARFSVFFRGFRG